HPRTEPGWTARRGPYNAPPMSILQFPRALLAAVLLTVSAAACGGGGTAPAVPAAPPTTAPAGDLVLYVALADANRVDAYRLGTDGIPQGAPFSSVAITNPRRLAFADGVLFVSGRERVISAAVGADGALPETPTSSSFSFRFMDNLELVVANDHVYVATAGLNAVNAYPIDDQGRITENPSSTGVGELPSDYQSLALDGDLLYAATRDRAQVDVFLIRSDGELPEEAENQEPDTFVSLPDDIAVRDGVLYVTSGRDANIRAYTIFPGGLIDNEIAAETDPEDFYSDLVLNGDLIYAAAFNGGQVATYALDATTGFPLETGPIGQTKKDPESFPLGLTLEGGILYVPLGGHGRVDAFVLRADGIPPEFPSGSTIPIEGTFPVDTVVARIR
ncbi:MAG: hypothetical protein ACI91F_003622, partial [Candidatus Binatia bacterium]